MEARLPPRLNPGSVAHCLEKNSLGSLSVPLAIENALPRTKIETTGGYRNNYFVTDRERAQVRGGIVFTGSGVVPVFVRRPRCDTILEPVKNVFPQSALVIIHEYRCGDVHRRHENEAFGDSGSGTARFDLVSDIDYFLTLLCIEGEIGSVSLHVLMLVSGISDACHESAARDLNRDRHSLRLVTERS